MEKLSKTKKIFNKIYHYLFIERFNKKIKFNFPENFFRWHMIEYLCNRRKFNNYLEIGCDKNELFSKIKIENKIGVDPVSGGNVKVTSDQFFLNNKIKFDLVFIDGLHEYNQVKRDIINSLKNLNENGVVLVHDCLPDSLSKQAVPRFRMSWNGDVWKAIVDLRCFENIEIYTCEVDQGIAIIQNKKNTDRLKIDSNAKDLKFKDFYNNHRKYMRIISRSEFEKKFN